MKNKKQSKNKKMILPIFLFVFFLSAGFFLKQNFEIKGKVLGNTSPLIANPNGDIILGANYNWTKFLNCTINDTGILLTYNQPGTRTAVQSQLAKMKTNGLQSLRLLIWHQSSISTVTKRGDVVTTKWGAIPSKDGLIPEPYRSNLINYLTDVKNAGFKKITITFGPKRENDPMQNYNDAKSPLYDPTKFTENWKFIKDVRALAKQYGPTDVRFDLMNEGAPWDALPSNIKTQLTDYLIQMFKRYVAAYGNQDVTIGFMPGTLPNLLSIFDKAGVGQPAWYHGSMYMKSSDEMFNELKKDDDILNAKGLKQPIVIGETYYNNSNVADGIKRFIASSKRPILEILEWPITPENEKCSIDPPYSISNYLNLNIPNITTSVLNTQTNPWSIKIHGTHFRNDQTIRIIDIDGKRWTKNIISLPNFLTAIIQLPSNNPPSNCNLIKSCQIKLDIVDPTTNLISNQININLPKTISPTKTP
jgi:hypothetical protein